MAHVGKYYPLAFRRDLTFDITTFNDAWCYGYHLLLIGCTGDVAEAIVTNDTVLKYTSEPEDWPVVWESGLVPRGGVNVNCKGTIDFNPIRGERSWHFNITTQAGDELVFSNSRAVGIHRYQILSGGCGPQIVPFPEKFAYNLFDSFIQLKAITWEEYNNGV